MIQSSTKNLIKKHDLNIGSVSFYKNFVISEMKEGIIFDYDNATRLLELCNEYYGKKIPFIYISNRINSYSISPTGHFKSSKMFPNLKGYGVVSYNSINNGVAKLEQSFLNIPTNIFNNLEDAIRWTEEIITPD
ncbi:hypothetical protein [Aquimarina sp. 2304DJ70-9]|uniref:hypothetical protein n=1 Tax=Aquimarina penaris TaxID=3231044 RepID=UPI0034630C1A